MGLRFGVWDSCLDPQLPFNIPEIPASKDHKGSIKGPLRGPGGSVHQS